MEQKIRSVLKTIEPEFGVKVLYACESGSRAWGFPSADSDYDVRFLYVHPPEWYLAVNLEQKRDVIEQAVENNLDVSGWDLRKALKLFYKSNPPLLEWLGSPIVYLEEFTLAQQLRELTKIYYNPIASMYHYLHMAQGNYRDYLQGEQVWVKKYFYVLRPLLAVNWLERGHGVVPTEFERLVNRIIEDEELKQKITALILAKKAGDELDKGPRISTISNYIDHELERLKQKQLTAALEKQPVETLNSLFRSTLVEVWGQNENF